jgi:hypothetical protein
MASTAADDGQEKKRHMARVVVVDDGDEERTIELRVEDGKVTTKVDGKEVPVDKLHEVLGDLGVEWGVGDAEFDFSWPMMRDGLFFNAPAEEPNVFMGIHMAEPGPALERHLRLEPGTTTMISALYEGLAAHEAGLEEFDIIVEVDGKTPANHEAIRKALEDKEPGDVVELTVIQEGRRRDVRVRLDAYDREKVASAKLIGRAAGLPGLPWWRPGQEIDVRRFLIDPEDQHIFRLPPERHQLQDLEKRLEERLRPHARPEVDDRLDRLAERLEELQEMLDELLEEAARERD